MALALEEAKKAGQIGEVPVGAILVSENGKILSAARYCIILGVPKNDAMRMTGLRQ